MQEYPVTRDGYLKAIELDANKPKFWTPKKLGAASLTLAMTTATVMSNTDNIETWRHFASGGSHITSPPGCDVEYNPTPSEENFDKSTLGEKSAATELMEGMSIPEKIEEALQFLANVPAAIVQHAEYMWFKRGDSFTMPGTDSVFMVHANEGVQFNQENFNLIYKKPLETEKVEYGHSGIEQMMKCYENFLFEDKGAAGNYTHIMIAPEGHCIRLMRFQPVDQVDKCDAQGATPPAFKLEFLGYTLVDYRIMMLSTPKTGEAASQDISEKIRHEVKHHYQVEIGQDFRLNPDERFVKSVDRAVAGQLYQESPPLVVTYPSAQTFSAQEQG